MRALPPPSPTPDLVRLTARTRPFEGELLHCAFPPGTTIEAMIEAAQPDPRYWPGAVVTVDGVMVPPEYWRARPKAGRVLTLSILPTGGGGGGGGKGILRSVLMLVVAVVAAVATWGAGSALVGAAVMAVGSAAVNLGIRMPTIKSPRLIKDRSVYDLNGQANIADPYGVVPRIYGQIRYYPTKRATDYTELVGDDQYLRVLFDFGHGPLLIEDPRLGDTPLSQFTDVQIEIRNGYPNDPPVTLYPGYVHEESTAYGLEQGQPRVVTTQAWIDEAIGEISFPAMFRTSDDGDQLSATATHEIAWSVTGVNAWTVTETIVTKRRESSLVRQGFRVVFPTRGQFDVRVTRVDAVHASQTHVDQSYLTAIRSVRAGSVTPGRPRATVALRIKATDQLNGPVDRFSCLCTSILPVWNGAAWVEQVTRNPAWIRADIACGEANSDPHDRARLDLPSWSAWAAECAQLQGDGEPKYTCDMILDREASELELDQEFQGAFRAMVLDEGGTLRVIRDVPQAVPAQAFSPVNSWGFKGVHVFRDRLDGAKVQWTHPTTLQRQEQIAYADGQNENTARVFETLDLSATTTRWQQAWRAGRMMLAGYLLRPAVYELNCDVEGLMATKGSLVAVNHDVTLWGAGFGRVKAIDGYGVTLDTTVTMEAGHSYVLGIRSPDDAGTYHAHALNTVPGEGDVVGLITLPPPGHPIAAGDLFFFGRAGAEMQLCLVAGVYPAEHAAVRLELIDYAPGVYTAADGPIPPYNPNQTLPPEWTAPAPAIPWVLSVISDERVLLRDGAGRLMPRIAITVRPTAGGAPQPAAIQCQYKIGDEGAWRLAPTAPRDVLTLYIAPVSEGDVVQFRLRSLSESGRTLGWSQVFEHVVVGRTTRPPDVTGLRATANAAGVQLTWDPVSVLDLVGYEIRRGPTWDAATVISTRFRGTSLFVSHADVAAANYWVAAIDDLGLYSLTPATVLVVVPPPASPVGFEVRAIGDDAIRATWLLVEGADWYEVRRGQTPDVAVAIGRTMADFLEVILPVAVDDDEVFWLAAWSRLGLRSAWVGAGARLFTTLRNTILFRKDCVADGWANAQSPRLVVDGDGSLALERPGIRGEYNFQVSLPATLRARSWWHLVYGAEVADDETWDDADYAWDSTLAERTWTLLAAIDGARVRARVSVKPATLPATLIDGWALNGTLVSVRGANPTAQANAAFWAGGRFGDAWRPTTSSTADLPLPATTTFCADWTFFANGTEAESVGLMNLDNSGGGVSYVFFVAHGYVGVLATTAPYTYAQVVPPSGTFSVYYQCRLVAADGKMTFSIRDIYEGAEATVESAPFPLPTINRIVLYNSTFEAPSDIYPAIANLSVRDAPAESLEDYTEHMGRPGWDRFVAMENGNYSYQYAVISLGLDGRGVGDLLKFTKALFSVDAPPVQESGLYYAAAAGSVIPFTKPYQLPPMVQATPKAAVSGSLTCVVRAVTQTHCTVQVVDAYNAGVAGDVYLQVIGI